MWGLKVFCFWRNVGEGGGQEGLELGGPRGGGGGGGGWAGAGGRLSNMRNQLNHNGKLNTWRTSSVDYCPGKTPLSTTKLGANITRSLPVSGSSELNGVTRRCQSLRLGPRDISERLKLNNKTESSNRDSTPVDQETKLLMENQVGGEGTGQWG